MLKFFREKNTKEEALEKLRQMEWVRNKQDSWHLSRFVNHNKIELYEINDFHFVAEALLSSFGQTFDLAHFTAHYPYSTDNYLAIEYLGGHLFVMLL